MKLLFVIACLCAVAYGDIYMHNPRGSNNRVDQNANAPANRLFDSQNNNQAGYNSGEDGENQLVFYEESHLMLSWTAQHGCGINPQTYCEMIVQYRCDELMRDGTSTDRPQEDLATRDSEPTADRGRHEPYANWLDCDTRERNNGLFTADQNVGNTARATRQNAGGGRSGYECAEERDYYPYWHPSYWKDMAVMTDNITRCDYYQAESQNVMEKGSCSNIADNNPTSCSANGGSWETTKSYGLEAPECVLSPWSRANIHGNAVTTGEDGEVSMEQAHYNLTIPTEVSSACVIRVRYNITTADYDAWNTDARYNDELSPITGDPVVNIGTGKDLQLNINTAQFGRTFQDRTHVFQILPKPKDIKNKQEIYNINVRGKRGNNAATYPNNEYDFAPNRVHIKRDDWVHWQWAGSNNNPNGNDRNNAVEIADYNVAYPLMIDDVKMWNGNDDALDSAAHSCGSEDANLQDVDPYCNVGLVQMTEPGVYDYMSTKNNAFSNRSQKGTVIVEDGSISTGAIIGIIIGSLAVLGGGAAAAVVYKKKTAGGGFGGPMASTNGRF